MAGVDTRPRSFGGFDEGMWAGDGEVLTARTIQLMEKIAGDILRFAALAH